MKKFMFIVMLMMVFCFSHNEPENYSRFNLVQKDSIGVEITYNEKDGTTVVDTGTILLEDVNTYVLVKRDMSKHSIIKMNVHSVQWKKLK